MPYVDEPGTMNSTLAVRKDHAHGTFLCVMSFVLVVPTIVGNSLILIAIARFRKLRKKNHYLLIGNLAISDLLVGLIVLPLIIMSYFKGTIDKYFRCLIFMCTVVTLLAASVVNLFILSLERFHAIKYPLQHSSRVTKRRVYIMITFSWIFLIVFGYAPVINYQEPGVPIQYCRARYIYSQLYRLCLMIVALSCIITSCVLYFITCRVVLAKLNFLADSRVTRNSMNHSRPMLRKDMRHSRAMLLVSGLFVVFWAPFCISLMIPIDTDTMADIRNWMSGIGIMNSCINWIIFGARLKPFKEAFRNIFNCKCLKPDFQINTSTD